MRVGILGGGQLGRMLVLSAYPLGISCGVFDPAPDACAHQVAEHLRADFDDEDALVRFAIGVDVFTIEWENVPVAAVRFLSQFAPVRPGVEALSTAQDRFLEKSLFRQLGIATPEFAAVDSYEDLERAIEVIGLPAVLKTRRFGYDGHGQWVLRSYADAYEAWDSAGGVPLILESFVSFERELSVIAVRSAASGHGDRMAVYPLCENVHVDGILRTTRAPAPNVSAGVQASAEDIARRLLEAMDYAGVMAVELFERDGELLANEIAPRVHNSGHWTIEGVETSQFENHIRAICGLPLGSVAPRGHSRMANLIGQAPPSDAVLRIPGAHLHMYGKEPRPGRKLGHVTVRGDDSSAVEANLQSLLGLIESDRL